ncbi:aldo/keto reductase [Microbacterium sp. HD4P20]|uniref:aldo/keto reductase n=1 Tax=Microbacterium sp. HD4P20 TaxID=2864874 RepID=UPI001C63CBB5|nr:aldo/keto reductase [Microbacterium sp. HD4P20]MCP2636170.1 aldo/keto reductase [Microbacterium sp. HD4P20]
MALNVSPLTLGTSGLGRDTEPGSPQEEAAVAIATDLLSSSHSFVDTSNNYAAGRSEAVLGLAIGRIGPNAQTRVISKVDSDPDTGAFDRDRVLRSFDETTARLGVDWLPLLHLHDPYTVTFEEAMARGGAVEGLIELRESGRVGGIGVAAAPIPLMARYVQTGVFDAVLIHNRFTVVDQSAAPVFADAQERGMTVFNAAPFGSGILATGSREGAIYDYRPATPELVAWVQQLEKVCTAHRVSLPAVALHYSLRSPLVDSTVVGVASPGRREQLDELAAAEIPDAVWQELDDLGPAPTPVDDSRYA